ncbi:CGNR zinc finger domain-containing protein [Streptomyces fenghuangensis]|uniref:CGNR zinc finger domain-containing protein n=1 Tax=Streptomyces sp. ICN903 TaxID=2964654 RepID=UPI001EDC5C9D|nr:CGNR zinc finger domain-containing protein [Streptomyces sp. ICN903]MCG3043849.1 ABATE domain-containing protein [Streptomyces sp. ICN903]
MAKSLVTNSSRRPQVEPLPVEFANTLSAVRGCLVEGLGSPAELESWLRRHRDLFPEPGPLRKDELRAGEQQLVHARVLRDALRRLIAARVDRKVPDPWDIAHVNRASGMSQSWPVLVWRDAHAPGADSLCTADAVTHALSLIARSSVLLLSGEQGALLRSCRAPGCVLFFYRHHPRRAWCSSGCGNRARVARHHARRCVGDGK